MGGPLGAVMGAALGHAADAKGGPRGGPGVADLLGRPDPLRMAELAQMMGSRETVFSISVVALAAKLAKADAAIGEKLAAAEAKIESGRGKALGEIETVAAEAAADIVRRLAGADVSADAALKAVKAVM